MFSLSLDLQGEEGAPPNVLSAATGRSEVKYVRSKEVENSTSPINNETHAEFTQRSSDFVKLVVLIVDDWDSKEED